MPISNTRRRFLLRLRGYTSSGYHTGVGIKVNLPDGIVIEVDTVEEARALVDQVGSASIAKKRAPVGRSFSLEAVLGGPSKNSKDCLLDGLRQVQAAGAAGLEPERFAVALGFDDARGIGGAIRGIYALLRTLGFDPSSVIHKVRRSRDRRLWLPGPRIAEAIAAIESASQPDSEDPPKGLRRVG